MTELYQEQGELRKTLAGSHMIDHSELETNVYKTVYSNQTVVITNYNDHPVEIDGMKIEKMDYLLKSGIQVVR